MKISLITACYNSAKTIKTAIDSVLSQKGVDVEYIVVDGGSKDGTVDIIKEYSTRSTRLNDVNSSLHVSTCSTWLTFKWISERDRGMYDAINKGIKMATGDVVGILNADDVLASDDTLAHIVSAFNTDSYPLGTRSARRVRAGSCDRFAARPAASTNPTPSARAHLPMGREPPQGYPPNEVSREASSMRGAVTTPDSSRIDAVYADIRFVREGETVESVRNAETVRYCSAKRWRPWMFRFAAMVPHPSFYVRRECFERLGGYSLDYRICADFELELRYLYLAKLRAVYLPECVVVMRMGGMSTSGWRSNLVINREDLRALRSHGIWSCMPLIYLKYLFKIWGFVFRK